MAAAFVAFPVPCSAVAPWIYLDDTGIAGGAWAPVVQACPVDAAGNPCSPDGSPLNAAELAARAALAPPFQLPPGLGAVGAVAALPAGFAYPNTALPTPVAPGVVAALVPAAVLPAQPAPTAPNPVAVAAGLVYAAPSVAAGAPPPPPPGGAVWLPPNIKGLGPLGNWPQCILPFDMLTLTRFGYQRTKSDNKLNLRELEAYAEELRDYVDECIATAGGPPNYVTTNAEMVHVLGQILLTLGDTSTSKKAEYRVTIDMLTLGGVNPELKLEQIVQTVKSPRRWASAYSKYVQNLAQLIGYHTDWARKHGLPRSDCSLGFDYLRSDVEGSDRQVSGALAKRSLRSQPGVLDHDVSFHETDNFAQTVVRHPKLQGTFRRAGLGRYLDEEDI